jgi:hypothetical protein
MSERLAHRDLCQHDYSAALSGCQQLARGGLPTGLLLFCLWKSRNLAAGIFECRESAASRQRNRRAKWPRPIGHHVSRLLFGSATGDQKSGLGVGTPRPMRFHCVTSVVAILTHLSTVVHRLSHSED